MYEQNKSISKHDGRVSA